MTLEIARKSLQASVSTPVSEDERAVDLVHAAEALLPADAAASGLAAFFAALYRGAPPEDITRYSAASLAAIAKLTFENTTRRQPRETLVHVLPFSAGQDGAETRPET